jgi:copper chaperone CopZ
MEKRKELIIIDGMGCQHCVQSVRGALEGVPGVEVEGVEIGSATLRLSDGASAELEAALDAVRRAGFEPRGTDG